MSGSGSAPGNGPGPRAGAGGGREGGRPLLLVMHDVGAARPTGIVASARAHCDTVFLADLSRPAVAAELAAAGPAVEVLDVRGLSPDELVAAAVELAPSGVVAFSDSQLESAARVAAACGLPYHRLDVVARLADKLLQRRALAEAGVQATVSVPVGAAADLPDALARTGLPAVLKPRRGAGSVDTCLVRSAVECATAYAELFGDGTRACVLEEYLCGDPALAGEPWGDYVSVESIVRDGRIRTIAVTGKLKLVPPFRETGMFVPAVLPPGAEAELIRLERAALRAVGVEHGTTHTELKLTPDGPRVIEVNGRLGGHVTDILRRACGVDLLELTVLAALGLPSDPPEPRWTQVAFQYLLTAPDDHAAPGDPDRLDDLADLPGVEFVDAAVPSDWHPDWRSGTEWHLGTVYGSVPDHPALHTAVTTLDTALRAFWHAGDPAPVGGRAGLRR